MVQVDVFWGYGWGASLAVAAGKQLTEQKKPWESKYFVWTLLFLSLFWAPTGLLLLLQHPSWETMQAANGGNLGSALENTRAAFYSMSEWIVLAFGITNITQGILGFWVGKKLLEKGHWYPAQLNWILGYFGMFFILLYGWDGLGYDRFLYDRDMVVGSLAWVPGAGVGDVTVSNVVNAIAHFLVSGVAMTLYIDAVWLIPPFFILAQRWYRENALAAAPAGAKLPGAGKMTAAYLGGVFVVGLGSAAVCALTVRGVAYLLGVGDHVARGMGQIPANTPMHVLAYFIGLPLALAVLWFSVLKPGRILYRLVRPLWFEAPAAGSARV